MVETVTENALRPRQVAAIAALLATGKIGDAATAGGVANKTIYAWLKQPAFRDALREAEGEALRNLARQLAGLGDAAAQALRDALDASQPMAIRLRAADMVTARTPALFELVDLLGRIEALETAVTGATPRAARYTPAEQGADHDG